MPVDFDSLGNYLRQERERQQVSLQAMAAATKIQLKFLEALEHDAYDQLPAPPFVVGFLRAYAQYIAIDPEMVLTAYRSLHRAPEPPEVARRPGADAHPVIPTGAAHTSRGVSRGVWLDYWLWPFTSCDVDSRRGVRWPPFPRCCRGKQTIPRMPHGQQCQ